MVKFKIEGPITLGKDHPIPALARKMIEDHLGIGPSNESKEEDKKKGA